MGGDEGGTPCSLPPPAPGCGPLGLLGGCVLPDHWSRTVVSLALKLGHFIAWRAGRQRPSGRDFLKSIKEIVQ